MKLLLFAICALAAPFPCWAQKGKLAFISGSSVFVAGENGANARRLTGHRLSKSHVRWSPDGRRLLWISDRRRSSEAVVTLASGRIVRRIPVLVYDEEQGRSFPVRWIDWAGWLSNSAIFAGGSNAPSLCHYDAYNVTTAREGASDSAWGCSFSPCTARSLMANSVSDDGMSYIEVNGVRASLKAASSDDNMLDSDLLWSNDCTHLAFLRHKPDRPTLFVHEGKPTLVVLNGQELETELPLPIASKRITRFVALPTGYALVGSDASVLYYESGSKRLRAISRDDRLCKPILDRLLAQDGVIETLGATSADFWPPIIEDSGRQRSARGFRALE